MPSTGEGARSARSRKADSSAAARIPFRISPSSLRHACAASCVSVSAKKSATRGMKPARLAACASCRPEMAAISSELGSACELLGKGISVAEVEINRLLGLDHRLEQSGLGAIFDVADSKRANADRARSLDRLAVVVDADALDSGGRYRVYVGRDQEALGLLQLIERQQPLSRWTGRKDDVGVACDRRLLFFGRAVGIADIDAEAGTRLVGQ